MPEMLARVVALLERLAKIYHDSHRLAVHRVLLAILSYLIARDECEMTDVLWELRERELIFLHFSILSFKVAEAHGRIIGNDDVARTDVFGKCRGVFDCLRECFIKIFPGRFMLGNEFPWLEEVDESSSTIELLDLLLIDGDRAAFDAEDIEEFIPEGLIFS